jgi:hypothetical protein
MQQCAQDNAQILNIHYTITNSPQPQNQHVLQNRGIATLQQACMARLQWLQANLVVYKYGWAKQGTAAA